MISEGVYGLVQQYGAEDNGIPYLRRVNTDAMYHAMAHGIPAPAGTSLSAFAYSAAMNDPLTGKEVRSAGYAARAFIREKVFRPIIEAIEDALTRPLEDFEREPYKYWNPGRPRGSDYPGELPLETVVAEANWVDGYYTFGDAVNTDRETFDKAYRKFLGDDLFENGGRYTITGGSEAEVYKKFNEFAMEHKFGDGLPLVLPTVDRVNAMLEYTTRDRDEVLGTGLWMRKGKPTVEVVAANAVMAGAKPEYFPVILAAIEAIADEVENTNRFHHAYTSGASYSQLIAVSGPIVEQIGMETGANFFGAGNSVNNTIGRAIHMAWRNIAHLWQPHIDTARSGRHNDFTAFVVAEATDKLPDGWVSFAEDVGFPVGSSAVGVFGIGRYMDQLSDAGSTHETWTAAGLRTAIRAQPDASSQGIVVITPEQAKLVAAPTTQGGLGLATKGATRGSGTSTLTNYATKYVIVAGTDPGRAMSFGANTHGAGNSMSIRIISTAKRSEAGSVNDLSAPGTPTNFTVTAGEAPGTAVLNWAPPARQSSDTRPITGYEVTATERDYGVWITVPGGADARSFTLTGLDGAVEYQFRVRAISGGAWAYGATASPNMQNWEGARAVSTGITSPVTIETRGAPGTVRAVPAKGSFASIGLVLKDIGGGSVPAQVQGLHYTQGAENLVDGITLNWRKPVTDGGSAITKYQYRIEQGQRATATSTSLVWEGWSDWKDFDGNPTYDAVTKLFSARLNVVVADSTNPQYRFQVRAVNGVGGGVNSSPTSASWAEFMLVASITKSTP